MAKTSKTRSETPAPARKPLKPQRRAGYSFKSDGQRQSQGIPGDYTMRRDAPVQVSLTMPKFNSAGATVIRPVPMLAVDPDTNKVTDAYEPFMWSNAQGDFGDWLRRYTGVNFAGQGDDSFTVHLFKNSDDPDVRNGNPYIIMYKALKNAIDAGSAPTSKWNPYIKGRNACVPAPCDFYWLQGPIFEHDGKSHVVKGGTPRGMGTDDKPQILRLKNSAGDLMVKAISQQKKGYEGDTDNFAESMVHGDPVAIEHGCFFKFFNPEKYGVGGTNAAIPKDEEAEEVDINTEGSSDADGRRGAADMFKGFDVEIMSKYPIPGTANKIIRPSLVKYEDIIKERIVQWDDILFFPEWEQLCYFMARGFREEPRLLQFCWADHSAFFTEEVKGILKNRTQVAVNGTKKGKGNDEDDDAGFGEEDDEDDDAPRGGGRTSATVPVASADEDDDELEDDDVEEEDDVEEDDVEEAGEDDAEEDLDDDVEEDADDDDEELDDEELDAGEDDDLEEEEDDDAEDDDDGEPEPEPEPAPAPKPKAAKADTAAKPKADVAALKKGKAEMDAAMAAAEKRSLRGRAQAGAADPKPKPKKK